MSVIYNVPPVRTKYQGRMSGSTCWFYSAKMILKFHERTDANSPYRKEYEATAKIRMAQAGVEATTSELADMWIPGKLLYQLESDLKLLQEYNPNNKAEIETTQLAISWIKSGKAILLDRLSDHNIFHNCFPKPMFAEFYKPPSCANDLEQVLREWGPVYAGGPWAGKAEIVVSAAEKVKMLKPMTPNQQIESAPDIDTFDAQISHGVVIAGVRDDTVFYKDPNFSFGLFATKFIAWREFANASFKGNVRFLHATCPKCPHLLPKVITAEPPLI